MNLPSLRRLVGLGPKLNCWPGCTAIILRDHTPPGMVLAGKCIRVTSSTRSVSGYAAWEYEGAKFVVLGVTIDCFPDVMLRPITPPDNCVSDSEVTELFKSDTAPMVTKEPAHG
jgi:hypothetical protein